jgi:hypothetical protein
MPTPAIFIATIRRGWMKRRSQRPRRPCDRLATPWLPRNIRQTNWNGSVDGDYRTSPRYALAYKGQPYTLEGNTGRYETMLLPFPVNVLNQMEHCKDDVWLLLHSQQPFDLWVFPDVLRRTFVQNYRFDKNDGICDA